MVYYACVYIISVENRVVKAVIKRNAGLWGIWGYSAKSALWKPSDPAFREGFWLSSFPASRQHPRRHCLSKAFPSDRRERFRGRWAAACGGSEEVGPPAVTMVWAFPLRRTTSSVFQQKRKRFRRNPPSPEPAASLPGEGFGEPYHPHKSVYITLDCTVTLQEGKEPLGMTFKRIGVSYVYYFNWK
jgi:hypothetical protein